MAKAVEIDEEELLSLRKLKGTIGTILANPKGKLLVQQAHKLVDPKAVTPELDQVEVVNEPVNELRQELAALKADREEEKRQREHDAKIAALSTTIDSGIARLKQQGWTEEGIAGVRKIMDENGITNPEIAANHYEKLHPPQMPATPSGTGAWNFLEQPEDGEDVFLKGLLETKGESNLLLDKKIRDTLQDIRGARR